MNAPANEQAEHAGRARRAARALALPAVLIATLCTAADAVQSPARHAAQAAAAADATTPRNAKPALMAWNRKRAFLIVDREGRRLGELTDFVIDRTTGRLSHTALVLEEAGESIATKAFPIRDLRWEADTQRFRSLLSRGGVQSLPDFSPEWLERLELDTRRVVEAGHVRDGTTEAEAPRFLLAGDVEGASVAAEDGSAGIGLGVILDMNPCEAAYFLLSSGEHRASELHPVPWNALVLTPEGGYSLAKTVSEMASAPAISKELIASLTMAGFRLELADFYGVPSRIDQRLLRVVNESGS